MTCLRCYFTACVAVWKCPPFASEMSVLMLLETSRDTQLHPSSDPPLPHSVCPGKVVGTADSSRHWPWRGATQQPHCMLFLYLAYNYLNFFSPPLPSDTECAPRQEDLGRRARGRGCEGALVVWKETLRSTSLPGCRILLFFGVRCCHADWRQLLCAVVFSFIQPSKRTPFRRGGGGGGLDYARGGCVSPSTLQWHL